MGSDKLKAQIKELQDIVVHLANKMVELQGSVEETKSALVKIEKPLKPTHGKDGTPIVYY